MSTDKCDRAEKGGQGRLSSSSSRWPALYSTLVCSKPLRQHHVVLTEARRLQKGGQWQCLPGPQGIAVQRY